MTPEQVRLCFQQLQPHRRFFVVSLLAHNLTIAARCYYDEGDDNEAIAKFRGLNELQHSVSGKLMALCGESTLDFPDEGFLDVLFEKAQGYGCEADLLQAFDWTLRTCA